MLFKLVRLLRELRETVKHMIVAVAGGKGGTGKTTVAASLAFLLSRRAKVLLGDIDVDNPCSYTLLGIELKLFREIYAYRPVVDESACKLCGLCANYCPVHALVVIPGKKLIFVETLCEGCGLCEAVCPHQAIREGKTTIGYLKTGSIKNLDLIVGELKPGSRKYHEVAEETMREILKKTDDYDFTLIDCPPGTGFSVAEAIKHSDLVVAVTEPSRLGIYDLVKFKKLVELYGKKLIVVANKYGLPGGTYKELEKIAPDSYKIPYDDSLVKAYIRGKTVVEAYPDSPSAKALEKLSQLLLKL